MNCFVTEICRHYYHVLFEVLILVKMNEWEGGNDDVIHDSG